MKKGVKSKLLKIVPLLLFIGCIEPFDSNFNISKEIIVVEGQVTDIEGDSYVKLQRAVPSGGRNSFFRSISGASVVVVEDEGSQYIFEETNEQGYYKAPDGFKAQNNGIYKLIFTTQEGDTYESNSQKLRSVAPIDSVYQVTNPNSLRAGLLNVPTNTIYIDTKDPDGTGDNYLWTWKNFEYQNICVTCLGGRWYPSPTEAGACVDDDLLTRLGVFYDYYCTSDCWDIFESNTINAQSDILSDGLTIRAREIAEIPYYNVIGGLIQISQQSVSEEAFNYLKLLIQQGQNTGGLADTPPAALIGNVQNKNDPAEAIGGYFLVTSSVKVNYWIDRSDARPNNFRPLGTIGGRDVNPEPDDSSTNPPRPPMSPCINGPSRTNEVPTGFKIELF